MFGQGLRQIGVEDSGGNRIDADAKISRFAGQTFRETDHRRLRCSVVHRGRQRAQSANRSDVENLSLSLSNHLLVNRLGDGKQTAYVRVDYFVPGTVGGRRKVVAAINRRVVHQNVEAAPVMDELASQVLHAVTIGYGDFESSSPTTQRFNLLTHSSRQVV